MTSLFRSKWARFGMLILLVALIRMAAAFSDPVETYYSRLTFPYISLFLRYALGFLPFSVGDLLYVLIIFWVCYQTWIFFQRMLSGTDRKASIARALYKTTTGILLVYCLFYVLWGLNYYRRGIEMQFGFPKKQIRNHELLTLTEDLKNQLNRLKVNCANRPYSLEYLKTTASKSYEQLHLKFPFIHYRQPSVKPSVFSTIGNYMGFLGYYNPFTGESQINRACPSFLQPFVACHEVAHQIGYASESEANFIGFIASVHSDIPDVQYSAYLHMYLYASGKLRWMDTASAKRIYKELTPAVQKDIRLYKAYLLRYQNPIQDGSDVLYDFYLKQNLQKKGLESYGEVVEWLLAYKAKYGSL